MKNKKIEPPKEHGGACPTCGHCKCCEKKAAPFIQYQPICTRPHYPSQQWPYEPLKVWYGTSTNPLVQKQTYQTGLIGPQVKLGD